MVLAIALGLQITLVLKTISHHQESPYDSTQGRGFLPVFRLIGYR